MRPGELYLVRKPGPEEGLKQDSSIHCDELVSLPKSLLTSYIGRLKANQIDELNRALMAALESEAPPAWWSELPNPSFP